MYTLYLVSISTTNTKALKVRIKASTLQEASLKAKKRYPELILSMGWVSC